MKANFSGWNEVQEQRELQAILALCRPNSLAANHLVQVFEIIRESDSKLYFVCEFMPDGDLKDFLATYKKQAKMVDPETIKSILRQVLLGLLHIHSNRFIHRDIKPENLLMSGNRCKVADFSLARLSSAATTGPMTTYVSSRWYRAPELVLEAKEYTSAIDIFALGCVMAEIATLEPLFPGRDEHDQFPVMMALLGPLETSDWPAGVILVEKLGLTGVGTPHRDVQDMPIHSRLAEKLNITNSSANSLLEGLLKLNPSSRPSAESALNHSYFALNSSVPPPLYGRPSFGRPESSAPRFDATPIKHPQDGTCLTTSDPYHRAPLVSVSPTTRETTLMDTAFDNGRVEIGKEGGCNYMPSSLTRAEMISPVWRPCQTFGID
jgi:male germ cell-associated kinase